MISNQTVTVTENKTPSDPLDEYNQFSSSSTRTRPEETHYCMIYAFRARDAITNSFADICALEKIMEKELKSKSPRKHVLQTKDNCKGNGKAGDNVKQLLGWINSSRNKLFESITFYYLVEGHTFVSCDHCHAGIDACKCTYPTTIWTLNDFRKFMKTTGDNTVYIDEIKDFTGSVRGTASQKKCPGIDSAREIRITKGDDFVRYRTDYSTDDIENHRCWKLHALDRAPVIHDSKFRNHDNMQKALKGLLNSKYIPEDKKTTLQSLLIGENIKYVPDNLTDDEKPLP